MIISISIMRRVVVHHWWTTGGSETRAWDTFSDSLVVVVVVVVVVGVVGHLFRLPAANSGQFWSSGQAGGLPESSILWMYWMYRQAGCQKGAN